MSFFTKDYHPPGTPPDALVAGGDGVKAPLSIRLIDYSATEIRERELANISECQAHLQGPNNTWIHVQGHAEPATLHQLGELFNLHPLAMEDVLNKERPKAENYDGQLFVILGLATSQ